MCLPAQCSMPGAPSSSKMWLHLIFTLLVFAILWYLYVVRKRKQTPSKERVILFSRLPEAGKVKTRLIDELGEAGAAHAQLNMTDHMLDVLLELQLQRADTGVEVKVTGGTHKQIEYWLGWKGFPRHRFSWSMQCDGHLGIRMADAINSAFSQGNDIAVIIGSDIPAISADILEVALTKLAGPGCEMVLGPAKDGGYYLVGLRREVKQKLGSLVGLFEGIEWSTSTVCQQQVEVASQLGIRADILPQVLQDVDTADDLVEFERALGVSIDDIKAPGLSIVIPTLNEEGNVVGALQSIKEKSSWLSYVEVIVSDGGSTDGTVKTVQEFAEQNPEMKIKTVHGRRGRGRQLNTGAREATGANLLFLHADARLPRGFDRHVLLTLAEPGNVAGAFNLACKARHHEGSGEERDECSWWIRLQLLLVNVGIWVRCRYSELAYGDQGVFMSRKIFEKVGQFSPYLLMEDYEMVKKLQRYGHLKIIQEVFAVASARRLLKKGIIKAVAINHLMVLGYHLGIHPDTLGRLYYG